MKTDSLFEPVTFTLTVTPDLGREGGREGEGGGGRGREGEGGGREGEGGGGRVREGEGG